MSPLSKRERTFLYFVEIGSWISAVIIVLFFLKTIGAIFYFQPPTFGAVVDIVLYGDITTVNVRRKLPDTRNELHLKARRYAKEGLVIKASECYHYLLKLTPDSFDCNIEYGQLLMSRGELSLARKYLGRALALDENSFYGNIYMASTLFDMKRPEDALAYAQKAHSSTIREPGNTKELTILYRRIGDYYFQRKRWDDAISLFTRADQVGQNDQVHYLLALSWYEKAREQAGLMRRAGAFIGLSSSIDPIAAEVAKKHLARCLELNPLHEDARQLRYKLK
jgi:tetratricopeptide (TPR) repeat protein